MPTISPLSKLKQNRSQCTVTFDATEVTQAEQKAVERLGESIRIEGFRPGRAPMEMLKQKINPTALSEETVRLLLPGVFEQVLKEHQLRPIVPPKVELMSQNPLTLTLTFVEKPDVKVKGHASIKVPKLPSKIGAEDVKRMLNYLQGQYRKTSPVEREAKEGDDVTMDFVGMMEGKEVPGTRAAGYKLTLGSKSLIPGFEEALVGLKKGDTKTFGVTFPVEYHAEHLRGKPVEFSVTIHGVEEAAMPELTDEFVKEHQLGESRVELEKRIEETLKNEEARAERERRERELFDAIRGATTAEIAPELLAYEERMIIDDMAQRMGQQNMSLEDWLKQTNRTPEAFQKEIKDEAHKRLMLRFAIQWLLEERKIDAAQDELATILQEMTKQGEDAPREGTEAYEEARWRKRVEKLIHGMLEA